MYVNFKICTTVCQMVLMYMHHITIPIPTTSNIEVEKSESPQNVTSYATIKKKD